MGEIRVDPSWMGFGEIGMMVAADWRGRGIGKALVAAAIEWARGHGLHKLSLSVFPHNEAAIALYLKFGFTEEGGSCGISAAPTVSSGILSRWVCCFDRRCASHNAGL